MAESSNSSRNKVEDLKKSAAMKETQPIHSRPEFGYLEIPSAFDYHEEAPLDKLVRKLRENPFVPVGLAVTTFALSYGVWQMKTGDRKMAQRMMRLRVVAQGFTVFAILGGVVYQSNKKATKDTIKKLN